MRPQKFRMLVNSGIQEWLASRSTKQLKEVLPAMESKWKKWAKEEDDFRSGNETYGYEDALSIYHNMHYISDRWRCAFRLKWIIDGLKGGHFFKEEEQ